MTNTSVQPAPLDTLFMKGTPCVYQNHECILKPDDAPGDLYYIESGFVRIYSFTEWGDEKLHLIFGKGEFFPTFWIFDKKPLTKYYDAMGEVHIRKINKDIIMQQLHANPDLLFSLFQRVIGVLELYSDRIDTLEYSKAYARVIARLLSLARRFGEKEGDTVTIPVPLTHADIALSVAITRETASRECKKLEDEGFIDYNHRRIVIKDIKKLEEELTQHYR